MTEPAPPTAEQLREFLYSLSSMVAVLHETPGLPAMPPVPREVSPAATRTAVDAAVRELCADLDAHLSRKLLPPTGVPAATLGRRLVSNGEHFDAAGHYAPGPGLLALVNVLLAENAATERETTR